MPINYLLIGCLPSGSLGYLTDNTLPPQSELDTDIFPAAVITCFAYHLSFKDKHSMKHSRYVSNSLGSVPHVPICGHRQLSSLRQLDPNEFPVTL